MGRSGQLARQSLLGSSRGSCNKNILYDSLTNTHSTYSHNYIRLYIFLYIHIKPYIQVRISFIPMSIIIYLGTHALMYPCTHVPMYSCTHVLMYSCTHVLMYSCTHVVNVYDTATVRRLYLRKNPHPSKYFVSNYLHISKI